MSVLPPSQVRSPQEIARNGQQAQISLSHALEIVSFQELKRRHTTQVVEAQAEGVRLTQLNHIFQELWTKTEGCVTGSTQAAVNRQACADMADVRFNLAASGLLQNT